MELTYAILLAVGAFVVGSGIFAVISELLVITHASALLKLT